MVAEGRLDLGDLPGSKTKAETRFDHNDREKAADIEAFRYLLQRLYKAMDITNADAITPEPEAARKPVSEDRPRKRRRPNDGPNGTVRQDGKKSGPNPR